MWTSNKGDLQKTISNEFQLADEDAKIILCKLDGIVEYEVGEIQDTGPEEPWSSAK